MLQVHADALQRVSTTYHEFLLRYKASANVVYGIVEGKEDPMFYRSLIERQLPAEWELELVPAGCKDNVLRAMESFDWTRFSPKRICFFVDRDLSDFIPDGMPYKDNVYVTDNYSIESDVVNAGVLKRLLIEVLNLADLKTDEIENIVQRFDTALGFFQESMTPIMAQLILWRRDGKQPCLNNIRPKDFFVFVGGSINLRAEFQSTLSLLQHVGNCVNLQPSQQTELAAAEEEFRQHQGTERFVRGKYLLWFLVEFALEIHRSITQIIARFTRPPKAKISIGSGNAMVVLAPRVRCPNTLQEFLERNYGKYISNKNHSQALAANVFLGVTA